MIKPAECLFSSFYPPPPPPGPPCTRTAATEWTRPGCPWPLDLTFFAPKMPPQARVPTHPLFYIIFSWDQSLDTVSVFWQGSAQKQNKSIDRQEMYCKNWLMLSGRLRSSQSAVSKLEGQEIQWLVWFSSRLTAWGPGALRSQGVNRHPRSRWENVPFLHLFCCIWAPNVLCDAHPRWWGWFSFPVSWGKHSSLPETPSRTHLEIMLNPLWGPPLTQLSWHIKLINTGRQQFSQFYCSMVWYKYNAYCIMYWKNFYI